MKFTLYDYLLYKRIANDDVKSFYDGLFSVQRILFLGDKYSHMGYTGTTDSAHVNHSEHFLRSLACPDLALTEAYRCQISGPFKTGHPFSVSLINGLYLLLDGKKQETIDYLNESLKTKTINKYKYGLAILQAIKAIAEKDEDSFLAELNSMLKLQNRIIFPDYVMSFINLEAIGLYNLADKIWGKRPLEPESEYWDAEYIQYSREHKPEFLINFSELSPVFARWIKELPSEISMIELLEDTEKSKAQ